MVILGKVAHTDNFLLKCQTLIGCARDYLKFIAFYFSIEVNHWNCRYKEYSTYRQMLSRSVVSRVISKDDKHTKKISSFLMMLYHI